MFNRWSIQLNDIVVSSRSQYGAEKPKFLISRASKPGTRDYLTSRKLSG
jgi:hypothetical protein